MSEMVRKPVPAIYQNSPLTTLEQALLRLRERAAGRDDYGTDQRADLQEKIALAQQALQQFDDECAAFSEQVTAYEAAIAALKVRA